MQEATLSSETVTQSGSLLDRRKFVRRLSQGYSALVASELLGILPTGQAAEPVTPLFSGSATGPLFIAGGGNLPKGIGDYFVERAGGKEKGKFVVISTADGNADDPQYPVGYFWDDYERLDVAACLMHTRDPDVANDPTFTAPLEDATGVWLAGGKQHRLLVYEGTLVERKIWNVLRRGGVVGGTSAGAAVMSRVMIKGGNPVAEIATGFGFLKGNWIVDQHVNTRGRLQRLLGVLELYPEHMGLAIDEGTAVVVEPDGTMRVMGEGTVTLCGNNGDVHVFRAGEEIRMPMLNVGTVPIAQP